MATSWGFRLSLISQNIFPLALGLKNAQVLLATLQIWTCRRKLSVQAWTPMQRVSCMLTCLQSLLHSQRQTRNNLRLPQTISEEQQNQVWLKTAGQDPKVLLWREQIGQHCSHYDTEKILFHCSTASSCTNMAKNNIFHIQGLVIAAYSFPQADIQNSQQSCNHNQRHADNASRQCTEDEGPIEFV